MKKIYKWYLDCGRMGTLDGIFIEDDAIVDAAIGKKYYFDEPLGKHSEVSGELVADELTVLSDDQEFIEKFEKIMSKTPSGFNPLEYLED